MVTTSSIFLTQCNDDQKFNTYNKTWLIFLWTVNDIGKTFPNMNTLIYSKFFRLCPKIAKGFWNRKSGPWGQIEKTKHLIGDIVLIPTSNLFVNTSIEDPLGTGLVRTWSKTGSLIPLRPLITIDIIFKGGQLSKWVFTSVCFPV